MFFPPARVRASRFYYRLPPLLFSSFPLPLLLCNRELQEDQWALPGLNRECQISVGAAGPQPRAPALSGHCRASTASARSQWALLDLNHERQLPDLNCELQISEGTARPQLRAPDLRGHCQTSTASFRAQWALPDLSQGHRKCQIECQKECQNECVKRYQNRCQKECQNICQKVCEDRQDRCQIECQIECQIKCQSICQKECQIECQNKYAIYIYVYFQMACQKLCQNSVSGWGSLEENPCSSLGPDIVCGDPHRLQEVLQLASSHGFLQVLRQGFTRELTMSRISSRKHDLNHVELDLTVEKWALRTQSLT